MKFDIIINSPYHEERLDYELPRIPVVGETITIYLKNMTRIYHFQVIKVDWDLISKYVIIQVDLP